MLDAAASIRRPGRAILSIVVPLYNEADNVDALLERFEPVVEGLLAPRVAAGPRAQARMTSAIMAQLGPCIDLGAVPVSRGAGFRAGRHGVFRAASELTPYGASS